MKVRVVLFAIVAVSVAACGSTPSSRINESAQQASLDNARRLQATQAQARDQRFLDELRAASTAEHEGLADDKVIAKAKASMSALTNDPNATRFRNVTIDKTHGFRIVCGEVSTKSTGGSDGFQRFYWVSAYLTGIERPAAASNSIRESQESLDTQAACAGL